MFLVRLGVIGEDAGKAIGLQLDADLRLHCRASALTALPRSPRPDRMMPSSVLHVMADLVRDDIGLREIAGRIEAVLQLLVEDEVDINLLVLRDSRRAPWPTCRVPQAERSPANRARASGRYRSRHAGGKCPARRPRYRREPRIRTAASGRRGRAGTVVIGAAGIRLCRLVPVQQRQKHARVDPEEKTDEHDDDRANPADPADPARDAAAAASVLDISLSRPPIQRIATPLIRC